MKKFKYLIMSLLFIITIVLISGNIYASDINSTINIANENNDINLEKSASKYEQLTNTKSEIDSNSISTESSRQIYNDKTVVPEKTSEKYYKKQANTTEKTDNITVNQYTTLDGTDGHMPFYMSDDSIAICIEPDKHTPNEDTLYKIGSNHTILNHKNGKNVTDFIKIYLYNHIQNPTQEIYRNDSDYTVESALRWGVWYFILQDYEQEDYVGVFEGFMKEVQEETLNYYKEYGPVPDEGILKDGITHYKVEFLNSYDNEYQDLIGVRTWLENSTDIAWAWKLVNETTITYKNETYTVNVTKEVPYNTTEEYYENITELVPYETIEEYTVNITKEVPYNTTETYTENITVMIPVNKTETYVINVTKQVPYNVTEQYYENITRNVPVNKTVTYVVNVTKEVPYNITEHNITNITNPEKNQYNINTNDQTIFKPEHHIETIQTKPGIKTTYENNPKKLINYKQVDESPKIIYPTTNVNSVNISQTHTVYKNVTTQEIRTKNITVMEPQVETVVKTRTVTKYQNITVPETRQKVITTYEPEIKEVNKTRNVTLYRNETHTEVKQKNVTHYKNVTKEVLKSRVITKYKTVTQPEERSHSIAITNYKYKLYIYLLYLDGNISYEDLVAIVGMENLQFNEDGTIELNFEDIEEVPDTVTVCAPNNEDIPKTEDNIDTSNPDNLEDPVIDAGIVNAEI